MQRSPTPFRRALALFLACQPMLWMSQPALAQVIEQQASQIQQADQQRALQGLQGQQFPGNVQQGYPPGPGGTQGQNLQGSMQGTEQGGGLLPPQPTPFGGANQPFSATPGDAEGGRSDKQGTPATPATPQPVNPVDEPIDPDRYVMGPGDVMELHFWGIENFRLRVTVDLEGRAFVPRIGYLVVVGKTLAATQAMLQASVARYYPKLGFGVTLAQPRTFIVQVVDDVVRPGPQQAKAIDRVSSVVMRAGGLGQNASRRRIELRRRDGNVITVDLLLYAITGDVKHNPFVLDGDVIRVPYQSMVATVAGAVNRPGRYELVGKADLEELVELAGGLSTGATRELPVSIVRRATDVRLKRLSFDFRADGKLPAVTLDGEDSVWLPAFSELQQSVTITGALLGVAASTGGNDGSGGGSTSSGTDRGTVARDEAAATRRLPFAKGDTVRSILERVGGPGPLADLKNAYILRNNKAVPVDLYAVVMLRDFTADRDVELGDTIVLPFRRQSVLVEGAVFKPGQYPYSPNFGVEQYVALAGGLNRFAQSIDDSYVVTPNGEMKEFSPDLKVDPGASLVVPERNFSRAEVVSLVLAGAGLLLSAVTIFLTLRK